MITIMIHELFFAKILVIDDRTPGRSFTSILKYEELVCFKISNLIIFFLNFEEIPNGYFILPLSIEQRSDINAEDVGPGPEPSH